ncbi:MAG: hypothetical protein A2857_01970 [Candidatus Levybacteria bacterium RIFCSPHIGHO2_01_FULL_36_15]|nr:MAG: hypothetical protein A2857_01970 [Candidatus Levybacteria bacterium RIFCSPHIGHO2_01_FULL_36_15]OGH38706.1 MAG: hypothetical protein A2905_02885 [Candidatus Levybacteria bacterium RIFCSPLOWO2_01_FULL_36_10]
MARKEASCGNHEFNLPVCRLFSITGLRPVLYDEKRKKVISPGNLETPDTINTIKDELGKHKEWFSKLMKDIKHDKKTGIFVAGTGSLVVFIAAGAGFEFGIRGGRDLKELPGLLKKTKSTSENKTPKSTVALTK